MAADCPSTSTGTSMYVCMVHTYKTYRIMGNRESAKAGTEKLTDSPLYVWEEHRIILLFVMLETGRLWGGVVACELIWSQHASGCVREKHMYVGIEAIEPTTAILVKTTASRHAYSVRTNWSLFPAAAGTRTGPCFACLAKIRMTWIFELSSFPSWLFSLLGKNARVATLTCTQEERDD